MKFYLSSYRFGNEVEKLKAMMSNNNNKIGHINHARDCVGFDTDIAQERQNSEIAQLNDIGFDAEALDLTTYFGKEDELQEKMNSIGAVWVSGGNTFVLRQAMKLSGFDIIFCKMASDNHDFLYGGYSAGICVLSKTLKAIDLVDDPFNFPYKEIKEPIWDGLGIFDYSFMPHYDSDHFESKLIAKEVQRCIDNKWLFKALRDGEVIVLP